MLRLKDIDFTKIQNTLMNVDNESERIRNAIGLNSLSVTQNQFFAEIEKILDNMNFKIHYTDLLQNLEFNGQKMGHLPSVTFYNHQYQKDLGGDIYIYDKYSKKKKRELLIHELIHIRDTLTPTWSTNNHDQNNVFMLSIPTIKRVELLTELTALALMMPINTLQRDLFNCSYDIKKIIADYKAIDTSTVIMWIILHDYFHAHYAILHLEKDNEGREWYYILDEYSNTDSTFEIGSIVRNTGSIAYKSWLTKDTQSGESTIDNKNYQCFCFYEKNINQPLPSEASPVEMIVKCDKMVIIGWSKHIYGFIQKLEFKQNSSAAGNP